MGARVSARNFRMIPDLLHPYKAAKKDFYRSRQRDGQQGTDESAEHQRPEQH